MAWVAVDQDGDEYIYRDKPQRRINHTYWINSLGDPNVIQIQTGSIKKLIGRTITWDDEPVELT